MFVTKNVIKKIRKACNPKINFPLKRATLDWNSRKFPLEPDEFLVLFYQHFQQWLQLYLRGQLFLHTVPCRSCVASHPGQHRSLRMHRMKSYSWRDREAESPAECLSVRWCSFWTKVSGNLNREEAKGNYSWALSLYLIVPQNKPQVQIITVPQPLQIQSYFKVCKVFLPIFSYKNPILFLHIWGPCLSLTLSLPRSH